MTGLLAGRRALVTGASRGIGAALAQRLAAEGADVCVTARTEEPDDKIGGSLDGTLARLQPYEVRAAAVVADLADEDDRARIVPEAEAALGGPIDVLVNNAATAVYRPLLTYRPRHFRLTFEVNVLAPLQLAQAVLPGMVERGEGWVVNLSSGSATLWDGPPFAVGPALGTTLGVYGSSKAALNRLTNALAAEVFGSGVRVNTVEPRAAVLSEGADALVGASLRPDQIESMEQMVEAIVALCHCPPEHTGRLEVSLDLLDRLGLTVHGLDGRPA